MIMNIFRKTIAVFFVSLSLSACDKDTLFEETGRPVEGKRTEMIFGFSAADMASPVVAVPAALAAEQKADAACVVEQTPVAVTRATSEGSADEKALKGLWVLQFDGNQPASKLVFKNYYAADQIQNGKLSVALLEAASTRVYFVGNVGASKFGSLVLTTTTLSVFEAMTFDIALSSSVPTAGLPMVGVYNGSTSASTATISLQRMCAKITFTCNVALALPSESFTVKKVQLKSYSTKSAYKAPGVPSGANGLYPDATVAANFADATAVNVNKTPLTQTWYVAENLRGVVAGLTDKTKGGTNAPSHSTYIEVSGDYTKNGETFEVAYRIYPGANSSTDFNLVRNHIYSISSTIKGASENDLRVVVSKGEDLSVKATANCYMVHTAGTSYKFKATVMGNGVTTPASDSPATGAQITPSVLTPASVKVLWETGSAKGGVISSVKLDNGYVHFTTAGTKGNTVSEGNALIGVFNAVNTLIWSWHIWATKYDPATAYDAYSTNYKVMQFNLGADANSAVGTVGRFGLLYQWGRKDPFIGAAATNSSGTSWAATAMADGYSWKQVAASAEGSSQITNSIQNPTTFYYRSGSPYDWVASSTARQLDNLWGNPNTTTSTNSSKGSKSIYDPCPPGWRVPPQNTWTGFTSTGGNTSTSSQFNVSGSFNIGWTFYTGGSKSGSTTFYPAAGYRNTGSGQLYSVGSNGYYWSSSPFSSSSGNAGYLNFYSGTVGPLGSSYRAGGFSVRCVQE